MKLTHCLSIAFVLISLALLVAGHTGAAGFFFVLSTVIELLGSAITGKQGNDTGH